MTDSKLRELERRWKETASVEDEAAYLLERVRVGDLEQEKLELAAYCEIPSALLALGGCVERPSPEEWVIGLAPHGREAIERAAAVFARPVPSIGRPGGEAEDRVGLAVALGTAAIYVAPARRQLVEVEGLGSEERAARRRGDEPRALASVAADYFHSLMFRAAEPQLALMALTVLQHVAAALAAPDRLEDSVFCSQLVEKAKRALGDWSLERGPPQDSEATTTGGRLA